jgi:hypothetical protein
MILEDKVLDVIQSKANIRVGEALPSAEAQPSAEAKPKEATT